MGQTSAEPRREGDWSYLDLLPPGIVTVWIFTWLFVHPAVCGGGGDYKDYFSFVFLYRTYFTDDV
jgi:hypothetical protein